MDYCSFLYYFKKGYFQANKLKRFNVKARLFKYIRDGFKSNSVVVKSRNYTRNYSETKKS